MWVHRQRQRPRGRTFSATGRSRADIQVGEYRLQMHRDAVVDRRTHTAARPSPFTNASRIIVTRMNR